VLNVVWQYLEPEGISVVESEHFFGFDVIVFRGAGLASTPLYVLSHQRECLPSERAILRSAAIWLAADRWDIYRSLMSDLADSMAKD